MKSLILSSFIMAVILTSCSPNNGSTPSSTPNGPIVNNATVYGGTMTSHNKLQYYPANATYNGGYEYSAVFYDDNGAKINVGTLKANNMFLTQSSVTNEYFVYVPAIALGPVIWIGSGNSANSVPSFNVMSSHLPEIPNIYPDTASVSQEYVCNHPKIPADSIQYIFRCNGVEIKKMVNDSSRSMSLSVTEMASFNVTSYTPMTCVVTAWKTDKKTIGNKYYNLVGFASKTRDEILKP